MIIIVEDFINRCARHVAAIIPKRTMCVDCSGPRVDRLYADSGRRRPATSGRGVSGPRRPVDGHARRRRTAFPRRPTTQTAIKQGRPGHASPRRHRTLPPRRDHHYHYHYHHHRRRRRRRIHHHRDPTAGVANNKTADTVARGAESGAGVARSRRSIFYIRRAGRPRACVFPLQLLGTARLSL